MRRAILLCFVVAFLIGPTWGVFWLLTNDSTRTDDYERLVLKIVFARISLDLRIGREVQVAVLPTIASPPIGAELSFHVNLRDPNNNWIDEATGQPYHYHLNGRFWNTDIEQGLINIVALETLEDTYEGEPSLSLDVTIRIPDVFVYSRINCHGIWRLTNLEIQEAFFVGHYSTVELRYRTRIQLIAVNGYQILGRTLGQSTIDVTSVNTTAIDITHMDDEELFSWHREFETDGEHVDEMVREVMSSPMQHVVQATDSFLRRHLLERHYTAPQITISLAAVNVSGFSCRRPSSRSSRATKLYN